MKKNALKILIPNATSPKNIGDLAMFYVLIGLIKSSHKNARITVHSADPHMYKNKNFKSRHTLYSWSVYRDRRTIPRFVHVVELLIQYTLLKLGISKIRINRKLDFLLDDYKEADVIVFVGGGYLRSKKGIKQSLNLFMNLLLFRYAALFSAKKIVAPVSVGPFGYNWQEKITANVLAQMNLVAVREKISYEILKKYKLKNTVLSSDHAFMIKKIINKKTKHRLTLGFTIREWLRGEKGTIFEKHFATTIKKFSQFTGARVQPIVQVDASIYGEDDDSITNRIISNVRNNGIDILKIKKVRSVKEALGAYSTTDLLLGTRMHSNILAAIQGTPFVAISYEHKAEGIARQLSMQKYCLKYEKVNEENLYKMLKDVYMNKTIVKKRLTTAINTIKSNEKRKWHDFLS